MNTNPTIGFVSLGCPKALVDSERILTQLRAEGYETSSTYHGADLIIVNTCGFIDAAIEESLETIGEALDENGRVIVTGCLGVDSEKILSRHPNVLGVTGPHAYEEVMTEVHTHLPPPQEAFTSLLPATGVKLTPRHYAYLKISEGCNHRCSFCIIPQLRGDLVSRPVAEIMQEAENLAANGVKELLVISQDTSAYGVDIRYRTGFWNGRPLRSHITQLAEALGELGIWVRLHYIYPYPHVDELLPLMAEGRILPYLDIPLQHANPDILRAMKRPAHSEKMLERIQRWREVCPDITLRSTFIVGFPGETDEQFDDLLDFLREARLDRVGCFSYSPVEGAPANALDNPVPEAIKQERLEEFMEVQADISRDKLQEKVGRRLTVLTDTAEGGHTIARSTADAPEIDGIVVIEDSQLPPGEFVEVDIVAADEHDLWGRLVPAG